ncbi:MAG: CoA-transferase subunit beta [Anaerolineales bacterium]|nr:CoA-transferase subunit beta [Anaerolineales bacterium]
MTQNTYTSAEILTINAARLLRDGDVVFVGVGLPNLACNLARRTHAPNLVMIYEAGVIGAQPARLPLSIGDPTLVSGSLAVCSMYDIFAFYLQRGNVDVGFLGGAQIDRYGNINATTIGDYNHPKVRLPGSGGAADIGSFAWKTIVIMQQDERRFVRKLDFLTTPGYLDGPGARERAGLARSTQLFSRASMSMSAWASSAAMGTGTTPWSSPDTQRLSKSTHSGERRWLA